MTGQPLWITWERQRRSIELAGRLGCRLHVLLSRAPYAVRALWLGARTARLLAGRPRLVFVQNPSILLATLAVLLRPIFGYALVVDRHSNFKAATMGSRRPTWWIFHRLSRLTVRRADLTVVTNDRLADLVRSWGGRPFVLPDPLPRLTQAERRDLGEPTVVCVSSFGTDEPIDEVLAAARALPPDVRVVVTGNPARLPAALRASAPANVRFSGFLPEPEYQSLLASCNVVLALTTQPHTLLCAAYEAVSLGRPLVLSRQEDLLRYFTRGCVATANDGASIAAAIVRALADESRLAAEARELAVVLESSWGVQFDALRATAGALAAGRRAG